MDWPTFHARAEPVLQEACLGLDLARVTDAASLPPALTIHDEPRFRVVYAPFSLRPTRGAKVAVVGLTPGFSQALASYRQFQAAGGDPVAYHARQLRHVSFAGSMRTCLVAYLDALGVGDALGLASAGELFTARQEWLLACSMLRYPVFVKPGLRNYPGTDALDRHPFLAGMAQATLWPELRAQGDDCLVVPLGKYPARLLAALAAREPGWEGRCLLGFPHTSGMNGHRHAQFKAGFAGFQAKVRDWRARLAEASPQRDG